MNKFFITGRLSKEPSLEEVGEKKVCKLTVMVPRRRNRQQSDTFLAQVWGTFGETCAKYLVKGQLVSLTGELNINSYRDRGGTARFATVINVDDIEFLTKPQNGADAPVAADEDDGGYFDDAALPY